MCSIGKISNFVHYQVSNNKLCIFVLNYQEMQVCLNCCRLISLNYPWSDALLFNILNIRHMSWYIFPIKLKFNCYLLTSLCTNGCCSMLIDNQRKAFTNPKMKKLNWNISSKSKSQTNVCYIHTVCTLYGVYRNFRVSIYQFIKKTVIPFLGRTWRKFWGILRDF